jgi:hypothetical protein
MSVLTPPPKSAFNLFTTEERGGEALPPAGSFAAVCIAAREEKDVPVKKFQSDKIVPTHLCSFLFQFRGDDGKVYRIETRPMTFSADPKANLMKTLVSWLGKTPPVDSTYDPIVERKGKPAMLVVVHKTKEDGGFYAVAQTIAPLPSGMQPPNFTAAAKPAVAAKKAAKPAAPPPPPPPAEEPAEDDDGGVPAEDPGDVPF